MSENNGKKGRKANKANKANKASEQPATEQQPIAQTATEQPATQEPIVDPSAVASAQQTAEEVQKQKQAEADKTLKLIVRFFRSGESSYRAGMLASGRCCLEYLRQRLALGATRAVVIQTIEGQLSQYATTTVNVNSMIRATESLRLLTEASPELADAADSLRYDIIRDHFSRLVSRINPDTPEEAYVLLPGMESDCVNCFRESIANKLDYSAVKNKASDLVREHTKRENDRTKQLAEQQRQQAVEAAKQAENTRKEREEADKVAKQAEAAAQAAKDKANEEEAAKLAKAAEAAKQALLAKQQEEIARNAEAANRARLASEAEKERKAAELAAQRQAEKDRKAQDKLLNQDKRPQAPEAKQGQNLLASAKAGTSKDVAAMAVDLLTNCQEPDTVFELLLKSLDGHKQLSKPSHRAIKAALVCLASPSAHNATQQTATAPPSKPRRPNTR